MRYPVAFLLLALAGCVHTPAPPRPDPPLLVCPASRPEPLALPRIVSLDRLAAAYHDLDVARIAERRRGDACAETVRRLHAWIIAPSPRMEPVEDFPVQK